MIPLQNGNGSDSQFLNHNDYVLATLAFLVVKKSFVN